MTPESLSATQRAQKRPPCPRTRVKTRPRKACNYPNMRSFGWNSYDKVGVLYSGKLGNRSEARASDLRSRRGLWWNRIKLHLYEGNGSEYSPRTSSIGRPAGGTLCPHQNLTLIRHFHTWSFVHVNLILIDLQHDAVGKQATHSQCDVAAPT